MTIWQRIREWPARIWFGVAGAVLVIIALILRKEWPRRKLGIPIQRKIDRDVGFASALAEERERIGQDITSVDSEIAKIDSRAPGTAEDVAKRWNKRRK